MSILHSAYEQIANLLANIDPEKLIGLKASKEMQQRYLVLAEKHKNNISPQEKDELDHFIVLERIIRLAKIKADEPKISKD